MSTGSPNLGAQTVATLTDGLAPVGLDELLALAELQQRVDRKYLVPADRLGPALAGLRRDLRVLEVGGRRRFHYDTVYHDTPDLDCYRHHVQGRRRRAKVRVRTYVESGDCMLEVKCAGERVTVKHRTPWAPAPLWLTAPGLSFVAEHAPVLDPDSLRPVAATTYDRTTLLVAADGSRTTVDVGLTARSGGRRRSIRPGVVVVETKTQGRPGRVDAALQAAGIRPQSISKYCLAVALLHPEVVSNPWRRVMRREFDWSA